MWLVHVVQVFRVQGKTFLVCDLVEFYHKFALIYFFQLCFKLKRNNAVSFLFYALSSFVCFYFFMLVLIDGLLKLMLFLQVEACASQES